MSTANKENVAIKRQRADANDNDDDDDEVVVTKVIQQPAPSKPKPTKQPLLKHVYIAFKCNYPLQNDKWGEDAGHETEDTNVIGVYANLREANQAAKYEAFDEEEEESDEEEDEDDEDLFYWQEEEPSEWTARRVWVERKAIKY